MCGAKLASAV
jgi:uncharacterized membrane protein YgcG